MGEKTKIITRSTDGQKLETVGELMDILESKEPWSEYLLEDGNRLRVRQSIVNIVKTDKKNEDGTPVYFLQSQPLVLTIPKV